MMRFDDGATRDLPMSRAAARRERLITTARALFAEHGFHKTGLAQISKSSGVLVGQIYRDFANKEAIVAAMVERDLAKVLDQSTLCRAVALDDAQAVRAWIRDFLRGNAKTREEIRLIAEILAESTRNEAVANIFRVVQSRVEESVGAAMVALAPEPEKSERRTILANVILTLSGGLFYRQLLQQEENTILITALIECADQEIDALIEA